MSRRGDDSGFGRVVLTVNCSGQNLQWYDFRRLVSHRTSFLCFQGVLPAGFHVDVRTISQRSWHLEMVRDGWRTVKHFLFHRHPPFLIQITNFFLSFGQCKWVWYCIFLICFDEFHYETGCLKMTPLNRQHLESCKSSWVIQPVNEW